MRDERTAAMASGNGRIGPIRRGTSLRVLVADDQDLVRSGFRLILLSYDGIEVVGEARDGEQAVELARRLRPDVVLMDIRMPHMDGIEATRTIRNDTALDEVHVLILTTFDLDEYVYDALAAGASGFLLKDADPDEIASAVRVVFPRATRSLRLPSLGGLSKRSSHRVPRAREPLAEPPLCVR